MPIITGVPRVPAYGVASISLLYDWNFTLGSNPISDTDWYPSAQTAMLDENGNSYAAGVPIVQPGGLGLIIPASRTNSLLQSRTFGTTWTLNRTTQARTAQDAAGVANRATVLTETATSGTHGFQQSLSLTSGTAYAFMVYVKPTTTHKLFKLLIGTFYAIFDPTGAGVVTASSGVDYAVIRPVGNGFYRAVIGKTATATASTAFEFRMVSAGITDNYTGATGFNIVVDHAWGGASTGMPINPIETTTTPLGQTGGIMRKDWPAAQLAGTRVIKARIPGAVTTDRNLAVVNDTTTNNQLRCHYNTAGALQMGITIGGTSTTLGLGTVPVEADLNVGFAWDQTSPPSAYTSGSSVQHYAAGIIAPSTMTRDALGSSTTGGAYLDDRIYKVRAWPSRLSDTDLAAAVDAL